MKKIIIAVLLSILIAGGQSFAQQGKETAKTDKEKQEKIKEKKKDSLKEKLKDDKEKIENDKDNQGKGHAYGKNKGDLQGKEFGQSRADSAHSKKEAVKNVETNTTQTDSLNTGTRDKIKQARAKLEAKKKDKKISDADYKKKKKEIDDLETELNKVEEQNKVVKDDLKKEK